MPTAQRLALCLICLKLESGVPTLQLLHTLLRAGNLRHCADLKKIRLAIFFGLVGATLPAIAQMASPRTFTIYEFLPWQVKQADGSINRAIKLTDYAAQFGIKHVRVIYEKYYFANGQPDPEKINALARDTDNDPASIVSFDTEFGNRFRPETVIPKVLDILQIYRSANPKAKAGVYAVAPQNTYGWKSDIAKNEALNQQYAPVAQAVDFLSPVLYNYNQSDMNAWRRSAQYNMAAAQKYGTNKPIIPYITPSYGSQSADRNGHNPVQQLTEQEMTARLQALYDLGAAGCIVWGGSSDRDADGKQPVFDASQGWGKALVEFAKVHK